MRLPRDLAPWLLAGGALFLLCCARWLSPHLQPNETVYMDAAREAFREAAAGHPPSAPGRGDSRLLFHLLAGAPVDLLGLVPGTVAGRVLGWVLVLVPLAGLARRVGVTPGWFLAAGALWVGSGQNLAAGEWIFWGWESKVPAYGALLAALWALVDGRPARAGALAGLSAAFHPLVGGWGALAMIPGVANPRRNLLPFLGTVALVAAPALLPAVLARAAEGPMTPEMLDILIRVRNPHHMDPASFMSPYQGARCGAIALLALAALARLAPDARRVLLPFAAALAGLFVAGLAARVLGAWGFLALYPFRVPDVMIPLLACLGAARAASARTRPDAALALAALGLAAFGYLQAGGPAFEVRSARDRLGEWARYGQTGRLGNFSPAASWIRAHTSPSDVFLAPPWLDEFQAESERQAVVRCKAAPHSPAVAEWYSRCRDLLGDPPPLSGPTVDEAGREHFRTLEWSRLQDLAEKYGARYYLVDRAREIPAPPAYDDGVFRIYPLGAPREKGPAPEGD